MVFIVFSLGGCAPEADPGSDTAAPSRFVRVHGSADPSLILQASIQYFTAAGDCRRASNLLRRLDGITAPQMQAVHAEVTRAADGRYEALLPLDQIAPGKCGWHPFVIAFQVQGPRGLSTGQTLVEEDGSAHLQPGAQGVVWVDATIRRDRLPSQEFPRGAREIAPVELLCRENEIRGVKSLSCVTPRPGQLAVISEEAKEVQVNFRDLTGMNSGF